MKRAIGTLGTLSKQGISGTCKKITSIYHHRQEPGGLRSHCRSCSSKSHEFGQNIVSLAVILAQSEKMQLVHISFSWVSLRHLAVTASSI